MRVRNITVDQLEQFCAEQATAPGTVWAISPERALSHARNPHAHPDDIALILAEDDNGELLAFIGLLPDQLAYPQRRRVSWISCWWAHPTKGKSMGAMLLLAAHKVTDGQLLADASPDTLEVFRKSRLFAIPEPKKGLRLFLRPNLYPVVARKKPQLASSPALQLVSRLAMALHLPFWYLAMRYWAKRSSKHEVRLLPAMDDACHELVLKSQEGQHFARARAAFDWISAYPWLVEGTQHDVRYPFSRVVPRFRQYALCLYDTQGKPEAFLWLLRREDTCKVCYAYAQPGTATQLAEALLAHAYQSGVSELSLMHDELVEAFRSTTLPMGYKHKLQYQYVWGKSLSFLDPKYLQYGDGDAVFA